MSLLVLMRHGRAAFGAASYDDLSSLGRTQAAATGTWLAAHRPDLTMLRCGPRRRHAETLREAVRAGAIAATERTVAGLDEFAEGEEVLAAAERFEGRPLSGPEAPPPAEQIVAYAAAVRRWAAGTAEIPGRAAFVDFRRTVRGWFEGVVTEGPRGRSELAVTSAGVIAAVVCDVLGLPDVRWIDLVRVVANASLSEIVFSDGGTALRSFNATGHLPPDLHSLL